MGGDRKCAWECWEYLKKIRGSLSTENQQKTSLSEATLKLKKPNVNAEMLSVVKERLAKWDKIATNEQKS